MRIAWPWLVAAWLAAATVCGLGMLDRIAEWSPELATTYFVWLAAGLACWFLTRDRRVPAAIVEPDARWTVVDTLAFVSIGGLAFAVSYITAGAIGPLPPAYHDEYSYLFGAQSVLAGRWTWPGHPTHPELFGPMHVLNEGIMASRYYPGTATWIAPWLALGNPWLGHWIAGALSAAMVYGVGRELGGRRCGVVSGLLFALAMGPALFANLLLAHHPTLLELMIFLWAFVYGQRTGSRPSFLVAGFGLSFAMLCRPATAAGFALPFGILIAAGTLRVPFLVSRSLPSDRDTFSRSLPKKSGTRSVPATIALGLPLVCGWLVMLAYNHTVTGRWLTSPYQLYTDIYTPRHVFGLNNVVRGEQHLGPKVLDEYDRWAENLTPEVAWRKVSDRLLTSGLATIDLPLLAITVALIVPVLRRSDSRWLWLAFSIVSQHAVHWFYWYAGIMGWHYVFETAPLWCLLCGRVTDVLWRQWREERRDVLPVWWCGLFALAWGGMYLDLSESWPSRWRRSWEAIQHPRLKHAEFRRWVTEAVGNEPALVLVQAGSEGAHLDYVINPPDLSGPLLIGRYRPDSTDLAAIVRDFPERHVYLCRPDRHELKSVPVTAE